MKYVKGRWRESSFVQLCARQTTRLYLLDERFSVILCIAFHIHRCNNSRMISTQNRILKLSYRKTWGLLATGRSKFNVCLSD